MADEPGINSDSLLLHNVTVVDTRSGGLNPGMAVKICAGSIVDVMRASGLTSGYGSESPVTVVDGAGLYVVPGFLDMHAHILENKYRDESMNLMLAYGVTGWRQMNGSPDLLEERRLGKMNLTEDGPELLEMPGQILTPANAGSPEISIEEVRRQKGQGADFIKTIAVSPKTFFVSLKEAARLGLRYAGHLSLGVSAVDAAKAGMRAIEHLGPLELQLMSCSKVEWLIRLILKFNMPKLPDLSPENMETVGKLIVANPTLFRLQMDPGGLKRTERLIDSFSEEKCRRLARACVANGTWQVPTLIRIETMQLAEEARFAEDPRLRYVPRNTRQFWESIAGQFTEVITAEGRLTLRRLMDLGLRMTKIFDECGVKMLAGSDFGGMWVIPGVSLHQEFDLLAKAGLSPLRVLQMTTLDGAEYLGREARMGTVEVGKDANLVLLSGNPIESVENLHGISGVVRAGRYYSREALRGLMEKVARAGLRCEGPDGNWKVYGIAVREAGDRGPASGCE